MGKQVLFLYHEYVPKFVKQAVIYVELSLILIEEL